MSGQIVQKENDGSLNGDLMQAVADYLDMPAISVQEVATFYDMFYTDPVGRHQIRVCTNVSCMLRGADVVMDHLKSRLNIDIGETTDDGRFSLFEADSLGLLSLAN